MALALLIVARSSTSRDDCLSNDVEQQQKINGFFSVPGDATQKRTRRLVSDAMFDKVGLENWSREGLPRC